MQYWGWREQTRLRKCGCILGTCLRDHQGPNHQRETLVKESTHSISRCVGLDFCFPSCKIGWDVLRAGRRERG